MSLSAVSPHHIISQGTLTVGDDTVPFSATSVPCNAVWVGATEGNSATVFIGGDDEDNTAGGRPLAIDNQPGFLIPLGDLSFLFATGTEAGDTVEYQVYGTKS